MRHVPHCFLRPPWNGDRLDPPAETTRHLNRVLRLTPGDAVTYTDGEGVLGEGVWDGSAVQRGDEVETPAPVREITIAVAPPKGTDRQRFVVEKLGEIGVTRLVWLETRFGDALPPRPAKADAWAIGALEQSRGSRLLRVDGPVSPGDLSGHVVVAHPGGKSLSRIGRPSTIAIGPAGGWHPAELDARFERVSLGNRILRTETAAIVAATIATSC